MMELGLSSPFVEIRMAYRLEMFPSIRHFWPAYLIILISLLLLIVIGNGLNKSYQKDDAISNAIVLYCGVWIAFLSLASGIWTQWRSSTIQHAVTALQSLRTDREYLICASKIKQIFPKLDSPMNDTQMAELLKSESSGNIDNPSFSDASYFVLNQYEFLGAAARRGAMDKEILRQTINGVMCGLVTVYAPAIRHLRAKNPETYANLVWLYDQFNRTKFK